jgi:hypothetical protein
MTHLDGSMFEISSVKLFYPSTASHPNHFCVCLHLPDSLHFDFPLVLDIEVRTMSHSYPLHLHYTT